MLGRRCRELLAPPRRAVAALVGASPDDIGFVTNATEGVNAVLRSIPIEPGDVLLTTSHVYNAVRQAMRYVARERGAVYKEIDLPAPLSHDVIVESIDMAMAENPVRLLVIDHVSSPTAIVFPVKEIIARARERGVDVLVDGAHAPGMLPVDLEQLRPSWYAANLHKWVCAPKGSGFLWARPDRQAHLHPVVISHFLDQGFIAEFDWQGTRDITAWLAVEDAIRFLDGIGLDALMARNHALAVEMQRLLCERWSVEPITPLDGSMIGSMASVRLPEAYQPGGRFETFEAINLHLYERHRIEVPVVEWGEERFVRPCCQVYNRLEQYERLAEVVRG